MKQGSDKEGHYITRGGRQGGMDGWMEKGLISGRNYALKLTIY